MIFVSKLMKCSDKTNTMIDLALEWQSEGLRFINQYGRCISDALCQRGAELDLLLVIY